MLMFGVYLAVLYHTPNHCLPSTAHHQNACDVGTPSHLHFFLGLAVAAVWYGCPGGARRFFADGKPHLPQLPGSFHRQKWVAAKPCGVADELLRTS